MGAGVQGALAVPRLVIKAKLEAVAYGITEFETEFMGNIGRGEPEGQMVYASGAYCQFYAKCHACDGQKRVEAAIEEVMRGEVEPTAPLLHSSLSQCTEYGRVDE